MGQGCNEAPYMDKIMGQGYSELIYVKRTWDRDAVSCPMWIRT